jgi:hypothetical protein
VAVAGQRLDVLRRVFAHPGGQLRVHLCHAPRRALEAGALAVLADAFEDEPDAALDLVEVNAAGRRVFRALVRLGR